jgi:hypothetical protein
MKERTAFSAHFLFFLNKIIGFKMNPISQAQESLHFGGRYLGFF